MKRLNIISAFLILALHLNSQASEDYTRSAEKDIGNSSREPASFVLKNGAKETAVTIDRKTEQSFQLLYNKAKKLVNFACANTNDNNTLESLSCQSAEGEKGKQHYELSFPACKRKGNGNFYKNEDKDQITKKSSGLQNKAFSEQPVIVQSSYVSAHDKSIFKPLAAFDYTHTVDGKELYYKAKETPIGSASFSLPQTDVTNICMALKKFNPINPSIYHVKFKETGEWPLFSKVTFSPNNPNFSSIPSAEEPSAKIDNNIKNPPHH